MTKKILLSVVASALLTTSAFAGTISLGDVHERLSTESYMQNGLDAHNFGDLRYTFETDRASGSISDPLVTFDVTALEFPFVGTPAEFDEDGKGTLPSAAATQDALITALEGLFAGTFLVDVATGTAVSLPFEEINVENGKITIDFDGSSSEELKNGHVYKIVDDQNVSVDIPYKFQSTPTFGPTPTLTAGGKILADAYSQTLDENVIDHAENAFVPTLVNQFKVACVRKFDGLINFENDRTSFVNPEHGERAGDTDADTNTDTMINNDRMIFTIHNARAADANATRWMSGASTEFTWNTSNTLNTFTTQTVDTFVEADQANVDTLLAGTTTPVTSAIAYVGNTFTVTYPNEAIHPGLTTFEVNLGMDGTTPIRAVKFTDPSVDLEQGLVAADELRSDIVEVAAVDGTYVENDEDNRIQGLYPHIAPQIAPDVAITDAGEWRDHAYIAQIAGASVLDGVNDTKVFIVNRSCATVTPQFKLIKDGVVTPVTTGIASIDPDNQGIYKVSKMVADMGLDEGAYALEVTLPGVAEDFYMYAQVKNTSGANTQFKDLPVYNTSSRD